MGKAKQSDLPRLHVTWRKPGSGTDGLVSLLRRHGHLHWRDDGSLRVQNIWTERELGEWRVAYRLGTTSGGVPCIMEMRLFPRERVPLPHGPKRPGSRPKPTLEDYRAPGQWLTGEMLGLLAAVPGSGITARLLRSIRVALDAESMRQVLDFASFKAVAEGNLPTRKRKPRTRKKPKASPQRKPGPKRRLPYYQAVAAEYRRALLSGENPSHAVAVKFQQKPETARGHVRIARHLGLLGQASHGKASF